MANPEFASKIEYGVAERPIPGEVISGDRHLIQFHPEGVLLAVVDGAGHGTEAAEAAILAISTLSASPSALPNSLLDLCHEALRSTRGAVISLVSIRSSDALMTWAGVGNVEVVHLRKENSSFKKETLLLRNGVVGYMFSPPRESHLLMQPGDMLIFVTDGIDTYFLDGISLEDSCQSVANSILHRHAKETDDALVLVVRLNERAA
jgi:serine/threonine protein phosphatase PrpC